MKGLLVQFTNYFFGEKFEEVAACGQGHGSVADRSRQEQKVASQAAFVFEPTENPSAYSEDQYAGFENSLSFRGFDE